MRWCYCWWFFKAAGCSYVHSCSSYDILICIATKRLILHLRLDKNEIIYIHLCYDMISYLSHHIIFIIIFRRIIWTVTCEFKYVILLDTRYAPEYADQGAMLSSQSFHNAILWENVLSVAAPLQSDPSGDWYVRSSASVGDITRYTHTHRCTNILTTYTCNRCQGICCTGNKYFDSDIVCSTRHWMFVERISIY